MSNIHQFTSKELILEKASQWISAIDRGLNIQEQEQFKLWMLQSTAHQNAVYELAQLWDDLSVLNELSVLFPNKHSAGIKTKPSYVYGIAASVVAALMMCSYFLLNMGSNFNQNLAKVNYTKIYKTKVGEQATYVLPDGTIVQLNTNSSLEVAYSQGRRQLLLSRGEGRFNVAKDASRPFSVMAGDKSFTALGTVFNVQRNTSSDLELALNIQISAYDVSSGDVVHPLTQQVLGHGLENAITQVDVNHQSSRC